MPDTTSDHICFGSSHKPPKRNETLYVPKLLDFLSGAYRSMCNCYYNRMQRRNSSHVPFKHNLPGHNYGLWGFVPWLYCSSAWSWCGKRKFRINKKKLDISLTRKCIIRSWQHWAWLSSWSWHYRCLPHKQSTTSHNWTVLYLWHFWCLFWPFSSPLSHGTVLQI